MASRYIAEVRYTDHPKPLCEMSDNELVVEHEFIDFDPDENSRSDQIYSEMIARGLVY